MPVRPDRPYVSDWQPMAVHVIDGRKVIMTVSPDPLTAPHGHFPLAPPWRRPNLNEAPSPRGLRPWGLTDLDERLLPAEGQCGRLRYDHDRQMTLDRSGRPLIVARPPTANTTSIVDGEDPPSSEDWRNDFHGDDEAPRT